MDAPALKVRHLSMIVIACGLISVVADWVVAGSPFRVVIEAAMFVAGWMTCPAIAFTEVPPDRLLMFFGLPVGVSMIATSGALLGLSATVAWALLSISLIAGGRAAMLMQMIRQRS